MSYSKSIILDVTDLLHFSLLLAFPYLPDDKRVTGDFEDYDKIDTGEGFMNTTQEIIKTVQSLPVSEQEKVLEALQGSLRQKTKLR